MDVKGKKERMRKKSERERERVGMYTLLKTLQINLDVRPTQYNVQEGGTDGAGWVGGQTAGERGKTPGIFNGSI